MSKGRMTPDDVHAICNVWGIDPALDWYEMPMAMKTAIADAAKARKYRKPRNYPASTGRAFCYFLQRVWARR